MNFKIFLGKYFLPFFGFTFILNTVGRYINERLEWQKYNTNPGQQDVYGFGSAFKESLMSDIGAIIFGSAIIGLFFGGILFFLVRWDRKAREVFGSRLFIRSLKPTISRIVATIITAVVSFFILMMMSALGYVSVSASVTVVAVIISFVLNLPGVLFSSLNISYIYYKTGAITYPAIAAHIVWMYLLVCFVMYVINLRRGVKYVKSQTASSVPTAKI